MKIGPAKPRETYLQQVADPPAVVKCANCSSVMRLLRKVRIADQVTVGLFYACPRYPGCECTHSAHPDGTPMGTPANAQTRAQRHAAHVAFDQLWKRGGWWTRGAAYRWLAEQFGVDEIHIGDMDLEQATRTEAMALKKVDELHKERQSIERRRRKAKEFKPGGQARLEERRHRAQRLDEREERRYRSEPPPEPEEEPPRREQPWRVQIRQSRQRAEAALSKVWKLGLMLECDARTWLANQVKGKRIECMTTRECELVETRVERLIAGLRMERKVRRAAELREQAEAERLARIFEPGWDHEGAAMLQAALEDDQVFTLAEGVRLPEEAEDSHLALDELERRARLDLMGAAATAGWYRWRLSRKERQEHEVSER